MQHANIIMQILCGVDTVQIPRIEALLQKYQHTTLRKIFTQSELTTAMQKWSLNTRLRACFLAKRFAAKEAVLKAIGTGAGAMLWFSDIEIGNDLHGAPYVSITSKLTQVITMRHSCDRFNIQLSLSDDYPTAIALCVISLS